MKTPRQVKSIFGTVPRPTDPKAAAIIDRLNRDIAKELRRQFPGRTAKRAR